MHAELTWTMVGTVAGVVGAAVALASVLAWQSQRRRVSASSDRASGSLAAAWDVGADGSHGMLVGSENVQVNNFFAQPAAAGPVAASQDGLSDRPVAVSWRPGGPGLPVRLGPRARLLVGREYLLAELDTRLTDGAGRAGMRVAVLCGLGGAGKTSLAVEYAHRHLGDVAVAWQLPAEDPAVLTAAFAALAAQLGTRDLADARDPVASVHAVLARTEAPWLLILDNAPDRAAAEAFVPPAGSGRVLITTQSQHWPPGQALDVPVLDSEVAGQFLVSRTGDSDRAAAAELAELLGGLPLALEQAAAYMQATGTPLTAYLSLFRDRQADLLARGEAPGHPAHVAATFGLALTRLAAEAPLAAGLLQVLAWLAPEPVPLPLLLEATPADGLPGPEACGAVGPLLGDPVAAADAVAALRRYSLIAVTGDGLAVVHRLVQATARDQQSAGVASQWKQAAAALVDAAVPEDARLPAAWSACAALLPHAIAVLDLTSSGMWNIGHYLGYSGAYHAAAELAREIADAHQESDAFGPEHPDTLGARAGLASWTGQAGDMAAARDQYAALLPDREQVSGPEHPDTLSARANLAYWTGRAGDPAAARDQFAALLPVREQVSGPEHPETLTARANLARWTGEAGDPAAARDQFAALLPVREQVSGPEHPSTLTVRANLAGWTGTAGNPAAARDGFSVLLPVSERVIGPEHPETLTAQANLARWTGEAGDPAAARDLYAAVLPASERVFGPEHPDTLSFRTNLAYWTEQAT